MRTLTTRLVALLAGVALAVGAVACDSRNENQINEGSESDEPGATVQTSTQFLSPEQTQPEPSVTQEEQPLTPTTETETSP